MNCYFDGVEFLYIYNEYLNLQSDIYSYVEKTRVNIVDSTI